MLNFKSKKQMDEERPEFALLVHDDYELIITEVKPEKQKRYQPKKGQTDDEEVINVVLEVQMFKDGQMAVDVNGEDAGGRKVFFTGRPESMGFMTDGTPSKTRCLVAYATGQDVQDELQLEDWSNLVGKTVFAEVVQYTTIKGQQRNKISRFLPPKGQRVKPNVPVEIIE
jgi:hypothetical protein